MALKVLFEDRYLVAVEKPSGLLSVPGKGPEKADCVVARASSMFDWIREVHRLDQATSGILLLARDPDSHRMLSSEFAGRRVKKQYQALVGILPDNPNIAGVELSLLSRSHGVITIFQRLDPEDRPRQIIDPDNGKKSVTEWTVMPEDSTGCYRLKLVPETGRTHQLRLTLAVCGAAILGDQLYAPQEIRDLAPRLMLHAELLRFRHPVSNKMIELESVPEF